LSTAEWISFFDRLAELKVFEIDISGGEIFLRDDLFVLLRHLRKLKRHRIALLTNGTLITPAVARELRDIEIRRISISIDGMEEQHDRIRGRGAFNAAMAGVANLCEAGIEPHVSYTPMHSNYRDLAPLIDLLASTGVTKLRVNTLLPEGRCARVYESLALRFPDEVSEVLDVVRQKSAANPSLRIHCEVGFYARLPGAYEEAERTPSPPGKVRHLMEGCSACFTSCEISANGDVVPCTGFTDFAVSPLRRECDSRAFDAATVAHRLRRAPGKASPLTRT
jgi:MoaA/NifB/PqqE/SkfB family radical SAM enzyme